MSEQESASESVSRELSLDSLRAVLTEDLRQRFLIGFLFAAAFFLAEAGTGEIMLARNATCIEDLSRFRLAPNPTEVCLSEFGLHLAEALSRGVVATLSPGTPALLIWPLMAIFNGLIGGGFAQLSLRNAVVGYLILHVVLLMVFMSVGYISQFIV